jgi:fluoride exporter
MKFLSVAFFGLVGVFLRYGINLVFGRPLAEFPWATFAINMAGSLLAGVIYVFAVERGIFSDEVRVGLFVGLLGGFTTFSAFSLESMALIKSQQYGFAAAYIVASPILGVALAFCGMFLTRGLLGGS